MALSAEEKVAWLTRVALFRGCSRESLERIAAVTGEVEFPVGQHIVQQGQIGNGLYILIAGTARVVRGDETLAHLGPGDFFGELAVLDQLPRIATVIAEAATVCLGLASWDLIAEIERDPRLALNLLRELAMRLRELEDLHCH